MNATISAKELRASLPEVVKKVRRGVRFTVLYRSRPAFQLVPMDAASIRETELESDPLYHAPAVGKSSGGLTSADHDSVLYGR